MGPIPRRLVRFDAGPADSFHEQTADLERVIADHFGIDAETALPGEPAIIRIRLAQFGSAQ